MICAFPELLRAQDIGPVAQLVEQGTFNPKVAGSIPARPIVESSSTRPACCPLRRRSGRGSNGVAKARSPIGPSHANVLVSRLDAPTQSLKLAGALLTSAIQLQNSYGFALTNIALG
jgi:hypothetical protein